MSYTVETPPGRLRHAAQRLAAPLGRLPFVATIRAEGYALSAYIAAVVLVAVAAAAAVVVDPGELSSAIEWNWGVFVALTASAAILERTRTSLFSESSVSLSFVPLFTVALLLGPVGGGAAAAIAIAVAHILLRREFHKVLFNVASVALATTAAGVVFHSLSGTPDPDRLAQQLAPAGIATLTAFAVNTALVASVIAISSATNVFSVWAEKFRWLAPHYLALGLSAFAMAMAFAAFGAIGVTVFALPVVMLWISIRQYTMRASGDVDRLHEARAAVRVTEARLAAEERFRALVQNAPGVIAVLDAHGALQYLSSDGRTTAVGAGVESAHISAMVHPADRESLQQALSRVIADPTTHATLDLRMSTGTGSSEWRNNAVIVMNLLDNPAVHGIVVNGHDVTERTLLEQELEEREQRYRSLMETVTNAILMVDERGRPTFANPAFEALTGYKPAELQREGLAGLLHEDAAPGQLEALTASLEGASAPHRGHVLMAGKDGQAIEVDFAASDFHGPHGAAGTLYEFADVTEAMRLREQLMESQKLEAIGTLVAGVAHDFNNLLTAIGGSIEVAREADDPSRWLDTASVAAVRAGQLVQQLLQFSRKSDPSRAVVDVAELMTESVNMLSETVDRRVEISFDGAGQSAPLWADGGQLQQVFLNLLVNARDAVIERVEASATDGDYRPRIWVELRSDRPGPDAEPWLEVTVNDNGTGMTAAVRERVFEPFFTTKEVGKGTGLGLSTAYGIIAEHAGTMTVESTEGEGTAVIVRIPSSQAPPAPVAEVSEPPVTAAQPAAAARLLFVDDEPSLAAIAGDVLTRDGYEVVTSTDGEEALRLAAERPFDLVLLDVNMPAPNGWAILQTLHERDPDQRVLMVSGHALEQQALQRGAYGLLRKPFDKRSLLDAVAALQNGDGAPIVNKTPGALADRN